MQLQLPYRTHQPDPARAIEIGETMPDPRGRVRLAQVVLIFTLFLLDCVQSLERKENHQRIVSK
jgi:hypothetical protein